MSVLRYSLLCFSFLLSSQALIGCVNGEMTRSQSLQHQGVQLISQGDTRRLILYTDQCFERDTYHILQSCQPTLDNVASLLKIYRYAPIKVAGYTDNVADSILAKRRAESVVAYLWSRGVPYQQLTAVGYGAHNPIASNGNVIGSAMNRRIEITWQKNV